MALNCDLNDLKKRAACLMPRCLGEVDRSAIDIYVRAADLAAVGGTDYTANLTKLDSDAAAYSVLSVDEMKSIALYIDIQNAIQDGATFGGDASVEHLKELSRCLECVGTDRRKGMLLYLKCALAALDEH